MGSHSRQFMSRMATLSPLPMPRLSKQVGEAVGPFLEEPPGHLPPGELAGVGLLEFVFAPGDLGLLFHLRVDADEAYLVAIERGVPREHIGDDHGSDPSAGERVWPLYWAA